jgi:hypothetical protein
MTELRAQIQESREIMEEKASENKQTDKKLQRMQQSVEVGLQY